MKKLVTAVVVICVALAVVWLVRSRLGAPSYQEEALETERARVVTLYFGSPDGSSLVPEHRKIPSQDQPVDNLRSLVEALVSGPREGGVETIPASVRLRGVFMHDKTAVIDFSRELIDNFGGGSAAEYILISSLVQTLCANFPQVNSVRILVEGEEIESIGGHISTARPLKPQDWR